jgi:hypothetical protein
MPYLEHSAEYMREYRKTHPEYYEKHKKDIVSYRVNRYNTDEEYREKVRAYDRERMRQKRAFARIQPLF